MSISATQGNATNNSGSVSSLAFASLTTVSGRDIIFVITLGSTSSSVSSISNSAGTYSGVALVAASNGTGVRVEVWKAHVVTGAATVFTVNITGGATSLSIQQEEYSGVSSIGNSSTASGSSFDIRAGNVLTQDSTNIVVAGLGFACQSGDTLTAQFGGERQKSIPAATAVGGCLQDHTTVLIGTVAVMTQINNSRNWAAVAVELRSGITANAAADYAATTSPALYNGHLADFSTCAEPAFAGGSPGSSLAPLWGVFNFADGYVGQVYREQWYLERCATAVTYSVVAGSLPTGLTLSSLGAAEGQVSGTPTVAGVYSFTLRATNSAGFEDRPFTITISVAASGGGSYTFLN
jgi:hypothetical protein